MLISRRPESPRWMPNRPLPASLSSKRLLLLRSPPNRRSTAMGLPEPPPYPERQTNTRASKSGRPRSLMKQTHWLAAMAAASFARRMRSLRAVNREDASSLGGPGAFAGGLSGPADDDCSVADDVSFWLLLLLSPLLLLHHHHTLLVLSSPTAAT